MRELTPEVAAALERVRRHLGGDTFVYCEMMKWGGETIHRFEYDADCRYLSRKMLDLFPPGYADSITPERLVACGGRQCQIWVDWTQEQDGEVIVNTNMRTGSWFVRCVRVPQDLAPRNMGEVWQLLDRLRIDWRNRNGGEA